MLSPDIAPHPLQDFEVPAAEGAFALLNSPLPLQAFATPAVPWAEQDWLSVLGFQMAAEGGASTGGMVLSGRVLSSLTMGRLV